MTLPQAYPQGFVGHLGEFEGLLETLLGTHASQRIDVDPAAGSRFPESRFRRHTLILPARV